MPFISKGTCIDQRFQIQGKLGRGGICEVYHARELKRAKTLTKENGRCALKCLKPKFFSHPAIFSGFIWENELLEMLRHPNIVRSYGFSVAQLPTGEDFAYIVLEYVSGKGMDQILKQHHSIGLPVDLVRMFIRQLGSALSYLHKQQLVHGDLKPSNLLVYNDCQLKLIDFGLACLLDGVHGIESNGVKKNRIDFRAGITPAYVSPDRLSGKALTIKDDIFAFACVIYELLSGIRPWKQLNAQQAQNRNLSASRLTMLNRREWRVLSHALALSAVDRVDTVDEVVSGFL
jgi:serine/threonine protein kinase